MNVHRPNVELNKMIDLVFVIFNLPLIAQHLR